VANRLVPESGAVERESSSGQRTWPRYVRARFSSPGELTPAGRLSSTAYLPDCRELAASYPTPRWSRREYRLPAVVAVNGATAILRTGDEVIVDGGTGIVRRVFVRSVARGVNRLSTFPVPERGRCRRESPE